jgi:RHS repeat-associated protein
MYYDANGTGEDYSHTDANVTWLVLPGGEKTKTTYDENRRKTSVTVAYGTSSAATTSFEYDSVGNLTAVISPKQQPGQPYAGQKTITQYDERNRAFAVIDPLGRTTSTKFDASGRKASATRPNTQVITYDSYDSMNRLLQQTVKQTPTPDAVTKFTYYVGAETGSGLLKTMQDPRLVATNSTYSYSYTYDNMGRKTQVMYPPESGGIQRTESWHYVPLTGLLDTFTNRDGKIQTAIYDALNRPTTVSWNDNETTPTVTYLYDVASRKTSVANSNATIAYAYLNDNLLSTETTTYADSTARTVTYTYNANGNRKTIQYPNNAYSFTFNYTPRQQLQTLVNNSGGGTILTNVYDLNGNLTTRTPDNSTSSTYTYDALDRVTHIGHAFAGGNTRTFDYGYHPLTNNRKWTKRDNNKGDVFGYDLNDEVTQNQLEILNPDTTEPGSPAGVLINYDANGNRTTLSNNSVTDTYTTNDLNQYASRNSITPTYDPKGNLAGFSGWAAPFNNQNWDYTFDSQNRLIEAKQNSVVVASFKYDGLNRQVSRTLNGGAPIYNIWDGWNLIEEIQNGSVTAAYLNGTAGLVKNLISPNYYYQDAGGSTSHIANGSGQLQQWYRYDLQGAPIGFDGSNNSLPASSYVLFLFTGQRWQGELGLYDLRNRFYSPDIGRFLQGDPIGFKGDATNLYRYCGNNPIMRSDLTGEGYDDPYGNPRLAAKASMTEIYPKMVSSRIEWGTEVYKRADGQFSYHEIRPGGPHVFNFKSKTPGFEGVPHGHPTTEDFSRVGKGNDIKNANDTGKPWWIVTAKGNMWEYDPRKPWDKRTTFLGRVRDTGKKIEGEKPKGKGGTGGATTRENSNDRAAEPSTAEIDWNAVAANAIASVYFVLWPSTGAEATNYNGQFQPDFAWGNNDPESPYPTGPLHSAWYGNHSWGW